MPDELLTELDPLIVYCGEKFDRTVPVLDTNGVTVPSGNIASARAQVREQVRSATVLYEWTTTGGTPNATVTPSGIRLTATEAETIAWQNTWPTTTPKWDLIVVDTTGNEIRLFAPSPLQLQLVLTR